MTNLNDTVNKLIKITYKLSEIYRSLMTFLSDLLFSLELYYHSRLPYNRDCNDYLIIIVKEQHVYTMLEAQNCHYEREFYLYFICTYATWNFMVGIS